MFRVQGLGGGGEFEACCDTRTSNLRIKKSDTRRPWAKSTGLVRLRLLPLPEERDERVVEDLWLPVIRDGCYDSPKP